MFKKKVKNGINYSDLTPVKKYEFVVKPDGLIDVLVPKIKNPFWAKLIKLKKSPYVHANFDELGSFAWMQNDGKLKVKEIADMLDERFGGNQQSMKQRLILFISQLYINGFIYFKETQTEERKHG